MRKNHNPWVISRGIIWTSNFLIVFSWDDTESCLCSSASGSFLPLQNLHESIRNDLVTLNEPHLVANNQKGFAPPETFNLCSIKTIYSATIFSEMVNTSLF